jgi:Stress responsive A/B Barrel Domain
MFIHHVFFTLKNPSSAADKADLIKGLNAMRSIEEFKMIHIGEPASTNREVIDRSYSVSWLLVFDNLADQEVYQVHPLHKKFVETCSHLWAKVVVFDSVNA